MQRSRRPVARPADLDTSAARRTDLADAQHAGGEASPDTASPGGGNEWLRSYIQRNHQGPYDRNHAPTLPEGAEAEHFRVPEGQLTFDAEGTEGGRYHSRTAHRPPGASGVTIGRGYDVGQHDTATVVTALIDAGLPADQAEAFRPAAGLRGDAAQAWYSANRRTLPEITAEQQQALFGQTYDLMEADVDRISSKSDTVERYGDVDLATVDPAIRDLVIDLRYRGDYTSTSRRSVQPLLVNNDLAGFAELMADEDQWGNVPDDRFARRRDYAQEALEERQIEDTMIAMGERLRALGESTLGMVRRPGD